jgi:hypothetical protein
MWLPYSKSNLRSIESSSRRDMSDRRKNAALFAVGSIGCALAWSQSTIGGPKEVLPSPPPRSVAPSSVDALDLKQTVADLEKELDRLEAASRRNSEQATQVLGPATDGHRRIELPQDHAALMGYIKQCLKLVEQVEADFGDLVVAEDEVDLRERIPDAHEQVKRLENLGSAGMLVRRKVRAWIEKDLSAVESLDGDWPAIRSSVRDLIQASRRFESGEAGFSKIAASHHAVQQSSATRIRFDKSRLGLLCRQTADAAAQMERKRQAESAVAMQP